MSRRTERLNDLIRDELSELVSRELRDPRLEKGLVSFVEVEVSGDLRYAKVYVSVFGTDEETKLTAFRRLAQLLTTRSEVFQILSVGQALDEDRVGATQRIRTIVQR